MSALFANLVIQQSNLALVFLGQVAHPDSGSTKVDLDSAKLAIDQLEMLQAKTKGNLNKAEAELLQHSLTNLRMAFVQAVNQATAPVAQTGSAKPAAGASATPGGAPTGAAPSEEESRKKFSKKY
jgi:hypothetical protein